MRPIVATFVLAITLAASSAFAESHNYSDFWGATNGATLNIVQTGETVTVTGFLYDVNRLPTWIAQRLAQRHQHVYRQRDPERGRSAEQQLGLELESLLGRLGLHHVHQQESRHADAHAQRHHHDRHDTPGQHRQAALGRAVCLVRG